MNKRPIKVAVIGGSGFYELEELEDKKEIVTSGKFGEPSGPLVSGRIGSTEVVVLARHGKGHVYGPTQVNYRANIWALKEAGVTHILAATACGSLREDLRPGDFVLVDSFVDRTTKRKQSFYDEPGQVCHIPMEPAFCSFTRKAVLQAARDLDTGGAGIRDGGTIVTIEGPRFSSRAESLLFRSWACDIVNMTTVPEVVLAAEAGIPYVSIAMVTDYDSWKTPSEVANVASILAVLRENVNRAKKLVIKTIHHIETNPNWDKVLEEAEVNVIPSGQYVPHPLNAYSLSERELWLWLARIKQISLTWTSKSQLKHIPSPAAPHSF